MFVTSDRCSYCVNNGLYKYQLDVTHMHAAHTHSAQTCEWLHDVLLTVHCQIADEEVISLLQPFFAAPHADVNPLRISFPSVKDCNQ